MIFDKLLPLELNLEPINLDSQFKSLSIISFSLKRELSDLRSFGSCGGPNQLQKRHDPGTFDYSEILTSVHSDWAWEEAFYYNKA